MKSLIIALFFLPCMVSCTQRDNETNLPELHGKTEAEVREALGAPTYANVIILEHGIMLPEFYIQVHNTYPPSDPNIEGIEIKELRWERGGYTETALLHIVGDRWVVLDAFRWADDRVF